MRPDDNDFDAEIRGHLAINIQERIARGEDPEAARRAAVAEFGYVPAVRDSLHRLWYSRWFDGAAAFLREMRLGFRSLMRAKGLAATIIITLALGIGANAAIFSVVRGVLLRPLVNRDEDRLIYVRQSASGVGIPDYTFSMPEISDFEKNATTVAAFGDFSVVDLEMIVPGAEPRMVRAGVVNGTFFDVMGLRPVIGRLLDPRDDGPKAASAAVLTYRFWKSAFNGDPHVVGKPLRLGVGPATIVGVLEPSVPYPTETEVIANIVTSPHHLGATMVTSRTHRMTELFGRLKPDTSIETARAQLTALHATMMTQHPEAYSKRANIALEVTRLRDQIAAPARTILLVLLCAAAVVFVIACSNIANLILARSVRREGELALRAALGASAGALRRTLLAESLVLCLAGAMAGLALAPTFLQLMTRYAAQFSVRALDVTLDAPVAWVGAGLAIAAAVLLAFVPRLPTSNTTTGIGVAAGSLRITPGTNRRLRMFATTQIACSFVLLAGAAMLISTLVALESDRTGFDVAHVLAFDLPSPALGVGVGDQRVLTFYDESLQRVGQIPGVDAAAIGSFVPWRDAGDNGPRINVGFRAEGYALATGEEPPRARVRMVSPRFFSVMGVRVIAGREFSDADRRDRDPVVIVNESLARRFFPNADALNRHLMSIDVKPSPFGRVVGIVADVDDEHVVAQPALTMYRPVAQVGLGGRLFVRTARDPYALVPAVTNAVRQLAPDQAVERAATLEDVRAEMLSPDRVNAFVFSGFAGIALLIAAVGVAGMLAFSVSARRREFGVRLAIGSTPRALLVGVLLEGARIVAVGIVLGGVAGFVFERIAGRLVEHAHLPGALPTVGAIVVLAAASSLASFLPASRASHVDVVDALRAD